MPIQNFTPDTEMEAETRRVLFEEAGEWARHYSNVRMTVITFVVTACVAILALKWDADLEKKSNAVHSAGFTAQTAAPVVGHQPQWTAPSPHDETTNERRVRAYVVANSVAILWILGSLVFQGFTYYTFRRMKAQLKHRRFLRVPGDDENRRDYPHFDYPSLSIPLLSAVLVYCLLCTNAGTVVLPLFSGLTYLLLIESIIFPFALYLEFRCNLVRKVKAWFQPPKSPDL